MTTTESISNLQSRLAEAQRDALRLRESGNEEQAMEANFLVAALKRQVQALESELTTA